MKNCWTVLLSYEVSGIGSDEAVVYFYDLNGNLLLESTDFTTSETINGGDVITTYNFSCPNFNMNWSGTCTFVYDGVVNNSFQFGPVLPVQQYSPTWPPVPR